ALSIGHRHASHRLIAGTMDDVMLRTPSFKAEDAREVAHRVFGVDGEVSSLPSERDQNFLLQTNGGDRFVLKIANAADGRALLDAQNEALAHIARRSSLCPRVIPALDGKTISEVVSDGNVRHFVRLFTWLSGEPLATVPQTAELLVDLGRSVAELDGTLEGFDHPAIHRGFYWDLAQGITLVRGSASLVTDEGMRAVVTRLVDQIEARYAARFARLRRAAVHNDPNDYNVLVSLPPDGGSHGKITGILDFGDIVYSYAIADLAIAIAYVVLDKSDPLSAAASVVRGYQELRPLADDEISSLFGLVLLRLCTSVCVAARQQRQRPDDEYLSVSQGPIAATLPALAAIDFDVAEAAFRNARGKTPEETLAARRRVIGPNLSVSYRRPVKIVRGWMQYLYDQAGRQYLDGYNNVPHVGHSHPRVVQAAAEQMLVLNTNTRYLHD